MAEHLEHLVATSEAGPPVGGGGREAIDVAAPRDMRYAAVELQEHAQGKRLQLKPLPLHRLAVQLEGDLELVLGLRKPKAARTELAAQQLPVRLVSFLEDLLRLSAGDEVLARHKLVQRLPLGGLVPPQKLQNASGGAGVEAVNVGQVLDLVEVRIVGADDQHLPVDFALVDERNGAHDADLDNRAARHRGLADVDGVDRVVVTDQGETGKSGVAGAVGNRRLPRLGNGAVVPVVGAVQETQAAVLEQVLLDWVGLQLGGNLHLGRTVARNLDDHVVQAAVAALVGDVVPGGDLVPALVGEKAAIVGGVTGTRFGVPQSHF
ncbi:DUF3794 domain-containing protein [Babesia caballi]|uniref:DUF3794 domain-containing protein n=1 Tax=Babesia caballi TaxID=5871 RepID=A0AAV4LV49_BABCB|nr:DUF3794 domain-containing protein [Babesia caballi]